MLHRSVLVGIADLLRRLHEASAAFVPPADARSFRDDVHVDMPADVRSEPPSDVISHSTSHHRTSYSAMALPLGSSISTCTRPGSRLGDVVNTAMWWVPLFPESDRDPALAMCNAPTRLAMFVDAYGLTDSPRATFCDVAIDGATRSWHRMQANAEQRGGGWHACGRRSGRPNPAPPGMDDRAASDYRGRPRHRPRSLNQANRPRSASRYPARWRTRGISRLRDI
jgi:hypothetical protein